MGELAPLFFDHELIDIEPINMYWYRSLYRKNSNYIRHRLDAKKWPEIHSCIYQLLMLSLQELNTSMFMLVVKQYPRIALGILDNCDFIFNLYNKSPKSSTYNNKLDTIMASTLALNKTAYADFFITQKGKQFLETACKKQDVFNFTRWLSKTKHNLNTRWYNHYLTIACEHRCKSIVKILLEDFNFSTLQKDNAIDWVALLRMQYDSSDVMGIAKFLLHHKHCPISKSDWLTACKGPHLKISIDKKDRACFLNFMGHLKRNFENNKPILSISSLIMHSEQVNGAKDTHHLLFKTPTYNEHYRPEHQERLHIICQKKDIPIINLLVWFSSTHTKNYFLYEEIDELTPFLNYLFLTYPDVAEDNRHRTHSNTSIKVGNSTEIDNHGVVMLCVKKNIDTNADSAWSTLGSYYDLNQKNLLYYEGWDLLKALESDYVVGVKNLVQHPANKDIYTMLQEMFHVIYDHENHPINSHSREPIDSKIQNILNVFPKYIYRSSLENYFFGEKQFLKACGKPIWTCLFKNEACQKIESVLNYPDEETDYRAHLINCQTICSSGDRKDFSFVFQYDKHNTIDEVLYIIYKANPGINLDLLVEATNCIPNYANLGSNRNYFFHVARKYGDEETTAFFKLNPPFSNHSTKFIKEFNISRRDDMNIIIIYKSDDAKNVQRMHFTYFDIIAYGCLPRPFTKTEHKKNVWRDKSRQPLLSSLLLHPDMSVNLHNSEGDSALHLLCAKKSTNRICKDIEWILTHGGSNLQYNKQNQTAWMLAKENKNHKSAKIIKEHLTKQVDCYIKDCFRETKGVIVASVIIDLIIGYLIGTYKAISKNEKI